MHIIDALDRASQHHRASGTTSRALIDPVVFVSPEGDVWQLGMVQSMWRYLFGQSASQICVRCIHF